MKLKILLMSLLIFFAVSDISAQVTPSNKDATLKVPDLTITSISRVQGKNELKIVLANNGKTAASKIKLRIYALPYGFFSKQSPYSPSDENINLPSEIPVGRRFTSIDSVKNRLGLAWTSVSPVPFDAAAGAGREQIVKFPSAPVLAAGETPKKVLPVPYLQESAWYLFAPWNILTFDLSVFYAVVETEGEVNKTNNEYFFNIRQRAN